MRLVATSRRVRIAHADLLFQWEAKRGLQRILLRVRVAHPTSLVAMGNLAAHVSKRQPQLAELAE